MSEMQKSILKGRMGPPPPRQPKRSEESQPETNKGTAGSEYLPASWEVYFDKRFTLTLPGTQDAFQIYTAGTQGPVFVMLHGGGHTALSWALVASHLKTECRVIAFDARGHGNTTTGNDDDLSIETLTSDTIAIITALLQPAEEDGEGAKPPPFILVGHSMGGAVAVHAASTPGVLPSLVGIVVIDVVEGTAMASLEGMYRYLETRPKSFRSVAQAIEWAVESRTIRTLESAKVSIPPMLRQQEDGRFVWRTDLFATEVYWKGWFAGLSKKFLSVPVPKLLLLAGTDRLDRELTIAQMQGRFQLVVVPQSGHCVQEDAPTKTVAALLQFKERFRLG